MIETYGREVGIYEFDFEFPLSPTFLSLYDKCKYAVKLKLLNLKPEIPQQLLRGIEVHDRLEKVINGEVQPTFQEMQILRFLNDLGHDFKTEQFIRATINGINYIGKYDVLINNGSIILDFKIPFNKPLPYKLPKWYIDSYQQILYQRIMYETLKTKPIFILIFYDPDGVSKVFRWFELPFIGISHWHKVEKTAKNLIEDIKHQNFNPTKDKKKCKYCSYKSICPYAS